jgi:hypothetical protein
MPLNPLKLINQAIKAVPFMKYALGVAGIVAVIALVNLYKISYRVGVIGTIIILSLMLILFLLSRVASSKGLKLNGPIYLMVWCIVVLFIAVVFFLVGSVFFSWPLDLRTWITDKPIQNKPNLITQKVDSSYRNISVKLIELEGESIDYLIDSNSLTKTLNEWFDERVLIATSATSIFSSLKALKKKFNIPIQSKDNSGYPGPTYAIYNGVSKRIKKLGFFGETLACTNPNMSDEFARYMPTGNAIKYMGLDRSCLQKFKTELLSDCVYPLTLQGLKMLNHNPNVVSSGSITDYSEAFLSMYEHICQNYLPRNFMKIQLADESVCGGGPSGVNDNSWVKFVFSTPVLKVGVLTLTNKNPHYIEVQALDFKIFSSDSLRKFDENETIGFESKKIKQIIRIDPNQTIVIPVYISFTPLDFFKSSDMTIDVREWSMIKDGYWYSKFYKLDSIEVNGYKYSPVRNNEKNLISISYKGVTFIEEASCPYVFIFNDESRKYEQKGTLIYMNVGKQNEAYDTLAISNFSSSMEIREIESEVSYLDEVKLLLMNSITQQNKIYKPSYSRLDKIDRDYLMLKKGNIFKLKFPIEKSDYKDFDKAFIISYGYYDRIK